MACNCKKNIKPVRTVVKKVNTNTTVNKNENSGTKIIRRNLKW